MASVRQSHKLVNCAKCGGKYLAKGRIQEQRGLCPKCLESMKKEVN